MYDYKDIRNFYFEDEKGNRIDCQKIDGGLFLYNVTGLGYEEDIEYEQIGNVFIPSSKKIAQNEIRGDLEFYNMTYDEYKTFIDFILGAEELKLIYIPKTKTRYEFYRDIDVVQIKKSEEDDFNVLSCPITMKCKNLWYKKTTIIYTIGNSDDEIRWDFKWDSKFSNYTSRRLQYINKGHVEAMISAELRGPLLNPKFEVYVEGQLYQTITINVEITQYEKLLYGTKESEFYINKQGEDGSISSLFSLDVLDIKNDNVIRLPKNKSSEIVISSEIPLESAQVTIYEYYKAV